MPVHLLILLFFIHAWSFVSRTQDKGQRKKKNDRGAFRYNGDIHIWKLQDFLKNLSVVNGTSRESFPGTDSHGQCQKPILLTSIKPHWNRAKIFVNSSISLSKTRKKLLGVKNVSSSLRFGPPKMAKIVKNTATWIKFISQQSKCSPNHLECLI